MIYQRTNSLEMGGGLAHVDAGWSALLYVGKVRI